MSSEDREVPRDGSLEGPAEGHEPGADGEHTHERPVERSGPERPEVDVESAFAAIVAGYGLQTPHGVGPWPAVEDVDPEDDARRARREQAAQDPRPGVLRPRVIPGEPVEEAEELRGQAEDEGYVPPEPPPLPKGDVVSRSAWAGVIGGPVFLLIAALAWTDLPPVLLLAALAAFVGGFVTLVARMPGQAPDDPDDGAVV